MKKILTLAIALVMVFAIAAPAFASGWDIEAPTVVEPDDITLAIDALSLEQNATAGWNDGAKAFSILEKTYPVIAGTKVHAVVTVVVPENLSDDMVRFMGQGKLKLKLSTSNLKNVKVYADSNADGWTRWLLSEDTYSEYAIKHSDMTFTFEITGEAEKSDKDAKIVAKLGVYNEWENGIFTFEKNGKAYKVDNTSSTLFVVTNAKNNGFEFQVDKDGASKDAKLVGSGYVWLNGDPYEVTKAYGNVLSFTRKDGVKLTSGDEYDAVKAVMDEIYGVLGFDYDGAKYMTRQHYVQFFGTVMEGTDGLTYPAGYVAELVTDDPTVKPPQTGDNASVVGFVMIAVALVAAAAVTVKKVRA